MLKRKKVDNVEFCFYDYYDDPSQMKMTKGTNNTEYDMRYDLDNNAKWVDSNTEMHFSFERVDSGNWLNIIARKTSDKDELYNVSLNVSPMYSRQLNWFYVVASNYSGNGIEIKDNEEKKQTLYTDWLEGINNYSIEWSVTKSNNGADTRLKNGTDFTISSDGKTITLYGSNLKKYITSKEYYVDITANAKVIINGKASDLEYELCFRYETSDEMYYDDDDDPAPVVSPTVIPNPPVQPASQPAPAVAPASQVVPSATPVDKATTFSVKNNAKVKSSAKIKIKDNDKIKKVTINGKAIKIKKNKTSVVLKLKSYKKKLKKKGKWNTLKVTDNKGNVKTIKFKTK